MHEFPEVQAMVRQACAKVTPGTRLQRLKIIVGEASGHNSDHIAAHFAEASRGTPAEGASLEFIPEKLAAKCAVCGANYSREDPDLTCAACGSTELIILAGNRVRLAAVETTSKECAPITHGA